MSKRIYKITADVEFGVTADSESGEVFAITLNGEDANDLVVGRNRDHLLEELLEAIEVDEENRHFARKREIKNEKKRGGPGRGYT